MTSFECRPIPIEYWLPTHSMGPARVRDIVSRPIWGRQGHWSSPRSVGVTYLWFGGFYAAWMTSFECRPIPIEYWLPTDRQIASLTVQCRQVYCLVEMAPSAPSRRPPHHGVSSTASQAGENDQTNVATQQWFQAFSTYPTLRKLAEEK